MPVNSNWLRIRLMTFFLVIFGSVVFSLSTIALISASLIGVLIFQQCSKHIVHVISFSASCLDLQKSPLSCRTPWCWWRSPAESESVCHEYNQPNPEHELLRWMRCRGKSLNAGFARRRNRPKTHRIARTWPRQTLLWTFWISSQVFRSWAGRDGFARSFGSPPNLDLFTWSFGIYEQHQCSHDGRNKHCRHDDPKQYLHLPLPLPIVPTREQEFAKKVQQHFSLSSLTSPRTGEESLVRFYTIRGCINTLNLPKPVAQQKSTLLIPVLTITWLLTHSFSNYPMNSITNLSADQLRRAAKIMEKMEPLAIQLIRVLGLSETTTKSSPKKRRKMSAAAKAKLSAAAKFRWKKAKAQGKKRL